MSEVFRRFFLSDQFINEYKDKEVPWGPLGYVTFKRTYARKVENEDRTEEWYETCRRVIEGMFTIQKRHCSQLKLPWSDSKAQRTAKDAYDRLFHMKWTPPGRGLWMMGTPYLEERSGAAAFNCSFISTETIHERPGFVFSWIMDALMLGIGVGFDTQGANKIKIQSPIVVNPIVYEIPDSREGWVNSVKLLIDSYLYEGNSTPIEFSYSKIRPYGELIAGFGGTSSGPDPLIETHKDIRTILERASKNRILNVETGKFEDYGTLSSVDIVDIANLIGRCVVAGNVRRSAELALGEASDTAFREMKDPEKFPDQLMGWRWNSNNTVKVSTSGVPKALAEQTATNGEPGYFWLENAQAFGRMKDSADYVDRKVLGVNPCAEITLESMELCNIAETYMWKHDSYQDYLKTLKIAYLYTKTVTLLNTHWPETNAIMLKNRRIGLSQSGVVQAIKKFGYNNVIKYSDNAFTYVKELDAKYSDWLCIPRSKKITTIKPSGTVSLLNGSTPGIHFPKSEFYIRRIRFSSIDPMLEVLREAGYHMQNDVYGNEENKKNTIVVDFPVREQYFNKSIKDVTMWEQVALVADYQYYWADNSVSCTIEFKEDEAKSIHDLLNMYSPKLKTISFLPFKENVYALSPYEPISEETYNSMVEKIKPLNLKINMNEGIGEKYCDGEKCTI